MYRKKVAEFIYFWFFWPSHQPIRLQISPPKVSPQEKLFFRPRNISVGRKKYKGWPTSLEPCPTPQLKIISFYFIHAQKRSTTFMQDHHRTKYTKQIHFFKVIHFMHSKCFHHKHNHIYMLIFIFEKIHFFHSLTHSLTLFFCYSQLYIHHSLRGITFYTV